MKKYYFIVLVVICYSSLSAQIINIPDGNFEAKLLEASTSNTIAQNSSNAFFKVDANNDSQIQVSEAQAVYKLYVNNAGITTMSGINNFTNLTYLECSYNQLTALDTSGLTNLLTLRCSNNQLTDLPLADLSNVTYLDCQRNLLSTLNLSNLTQLTTLTCNHNQLSTLDLTQATHMQAFDCKNNQLISLFIKNGLQEICFFENNPALEYICIDELELAHIQSKLLQFGFTNVEVNSYCSFSPGGTYYTIQGNSSYDYNANGCDAGDIVIPNLKLAFNVGTNTVNLIGNTAGNYQYNTLAGTYGITPIFENSDYFTISPSTATVTFPTTTSPFVQDFCFAANGIHNDLEVKLLPISIARPGIDAIYKITYKNKGTHSQSGILNFTFDDARMDFVSSSTTISSNTANNLSWSFTNLLPFETRQIVVVLNINMPSESLPVDGGDVLNYGSTIVAGADETPLDNIAVLNQTVLNALDPNDKTCIEGTTITPEMVGKEVHYLIRFENTGTANAENIVVKDMIDTAKFDIASLIPIDGSHPFVTKISNTNKVEFIFENINLPFDDANNDGYIAFKIKTKPTLVVGNSFSNTASIYFDYNFPIITNTATTTVALLANVDFAFEDYFKIYPNPANDVLNIDAKQTIEVTSINIYNTLGQIVLVIPNAQQVKSVDVSGLKTGNYFLKINSDKGSSSVKFVKM
jgi:hypothetical protein